MRLIDADALIKYCDDNWIPLNVDAVNAQPTIEERKMGKWKKVSASRYITSGRRYAYKCIACGDIYDLYSNYCPNCGADMRGDHHETP